jgi:hypothetical protein
VEEQKLLLIYVRVGARARARVSACVHIALLIQHLMRRHIDICGLSGSTKFSTLSQKQGTIFGKRC